jgi:hypothetical protein
MAEAAVATSTPDSGPGWARIPTPVGTVSYRPLAPGEDRLATGQRVAWQTSEWGCLECCIATLFEVDRAEIPARPIGDDASSLPLQLAVVNATEQLHAWVRARGLRMRYREIVPQVFGGWWIGVRADVWGWSHTVLCRGRTVVFDPALACPVPPGCMVAPVERLDYAITFAPVAG